MKDHRTHRSFAVAAVAILLSAVSAQPPKVSVPPAPATHSERMALLMDDPATKLVADRLDGDIRSIDMNLQIVRAHTARLRATLAIASEPTTQTELEQYRRVASALQAVRLSMAGVQLDVARCKDLCADAELAGILEEAPPAGHRERMSGFISSAEEGTAELAKQVAQLRELASELPNDPNLPTLIERTAESVDALGQTIAFCRDALSGSAPDVDHR